MTMRQRLLIWSATAALVLASGMFAWRSIPAYPRLRLRDPVLALPNPNTVQDPRQNDRPLFLVVIENTPQARPQSGLADACLVYALPTEARITRFMAAFCDRTPAAIGPVRSVRRHMLDLSSDIGAVLVHAGYSEEARQLIAGNRLPVINQFARPAPFWRDSTRPMPHNLYTGFDRLLLEAAKRPVEVLEKPLPFTFSYDGPSAATAPAPAAVVTLDYGSPYAVRYTYEAARRRYLREQDDAPHRDTDGRQIAASSVLVVFVRWRDNLVNGTPSSQIDLVGDGRLAIISGGRLIEGRWMRGVGGPLTLANGAGRGVVLPPGPVWIELFPANRPFDVQGEAGR
jgi:hypothetical protein